MEGKLKTILSELRERLQALYGERLVHMVLYGSRARGDSEPGSDVDILVVLKGPVSPCEEIARTCDDVARISLDHGVAVVCTFVSEDQFEHERSALLLNVRREGAAV